jgi:uncharacterized protein YbjT (DUF2867 family)/predicted SnoaL-like aldol condensation-catalyzing enzyme
MVRSNPGLGEVAADFADRASLRAALAGADTVFLVCSPIPQLVELEGNMIEACVEAGIGHVVLLSALGAGDYAKSFPSWHRKVEDKLRASGMAYTILRPNGFFQNIGAFYAPTISAQGAFYASMGDIKTSFLDVRDVGSAAATILAAPSVHAGQIYELNGPEAVSYAEIADRISRVADRLVRYVNIPEEAQSKSMLGLGMPAWQVEALIELQQYYVSGKAGSVTDTLPGLLGRPPITLDEYLAEHKDSFLPVNPKTGMTSAEIKRFVRNHFEEFVNRKNLDIADVNFAVEFVDHGADVPADMPPGPAGAKAYVGGAYKKFPDIHVEILDLIAEDDRVVVRNHWTGTEAASGKKYQFSGIVIWRVAHRQLVERWAYLTPATEVHGDV